MAEETNDWQERFAGNVRAIDAMLTRAPNMAAGDLWSKVLRDFLTDLREEMLEGLTYVDDRVDELTPEFDMWAETEGYVALLGSLVDALVVAAGGPQKIPANLRLAFEEARTVGTKWAAEFNEARTAAAEDDDEDDEDEDEGDDGDANTDPVTDPTIQAPGVTA